MIDPSDIVTNLVALLRTVPELRAEMNGDTDAIYAYHDAYPKRESLVRAIHEMPLPGIMVAWQGTQPGSFSAMDVWKHQITLYLRSRETLEGNTPTSYYRLFRMIVKGIPAGTTTAMLDTVVHLSCYPMDLPAIQRQTDAEGLDYFEVPITFTEMGDG